MPIPKRKMKYSEISYAILISRLGVTPENLKPTPSPKLLFFFIDPSFSKPRLSEPNVQDISVDFRHQQHYSLDENKNPHEIEE
jgi:hypothetical protein